MEVEVSKYCPECHGRGKVDAKQYGKYGAKVCSKCEGRGGTNLDWGHDPHQYHPERQPEELFLGNTNLGRWPNPRYSELKTLRRGKQAFSIDNKPLTEVDNMAPMFVHYSEYTRFNEIAESK